MKGQCVRPHRTNELGGSIRPDMRTADKAYFVVAGVESYALATDLYARTVLAFRLLLDSMRLGYVEARNMRLRDC